jgi:hypothetical protein
MPTPSNVAPEPLPLRWGLILIGALAVAALVGALTLTQTADWPAAILAALAAGGATIAALHGLLGK